MKSRIASVWGNIAVALLCAVALSASAQTNTVPIFQNMEITSETFEFDSKANTAVYRGNVEVRDPKLHLNCELLTVFLPASGGKIDRIVAETNVVMDMFDDKGQKTHGTGDKAVYTYSASETATNEIVELMGTPVLETEQGRLTGEVITYDRATGKLRATAPRMMISTQSATNAPASSSAIAGTNSAAPAQTETNVSPELRPESW